jgi:TRAP-type C4-dicarboxylate transport system permease small subunit
VAALLTIFIVAIIDQLLPPPLNSPLSAAAIVGGALIIGAFIVLAWASYNEMNEERKEKGDVEESDIDD